MLAFCAYINAHNVRGPSSDEDSPLAKGFSYLHMDKNSFLSHPLKIILNYLATALRIMVPSAHCFVNESSF